MNAAVPRGEADVEVLEDLHWTLLRVAQRLPDGSPWQEACEKMAVPVGRSISRRTAQPAPAPRGRPQLRLVE